MKRISTENTTIIKGQRRPELQSSSVVMLISPEGFHPNPETSESNRFQIQKKLSPDDKTLLRDKAIREHMTLVSKLKEKGIKVIEIKGTGNLPDEVFLNNWFSTHGDTLVLYPMMSENRRKERRADIVSKLKTIYPKCIDLSSFENRGSYLEGTGALVLDRVNKVAYAAKSSRCDENLVKMWAEKLGYQAVIFDSLDEDDAPIYHTNVMMWIGSGITGICLDSIKNPQQRRVVRESLAKNHEILELSQEQVKNFAGNAFEVSDPKGKKSLFMSQKALDSLSLKQKLLLIKHYGQENLISVPFPSLQTAGGSVRCSIAAIYSDKNNELISRAFSAQ
jgi:hypothetical protein